MASLKFLGSLMVVIFAWFLSWCARMWFFHQSSSDLRALSGYLELPMISLSYYGSRGVLVADFLPWSRFDACALKWILWPECWPPHLHPWCRSPYLPLKGCCHLIPIRPWLIWRICPLWPLVFRQCSHLDNPPNIFCPWRISHPDYWWFSLFPNKWANTSSCLSNIRENKHLTPLASNLVRLWYSILT